MSKDGFSEKICRVCLLDAPFVIDRLFDYYLPEPLWEEDASPGRLVTVAFGAGDRLAYGVIWERGEAPTADGLKPIVSLCSQTFTLDEGMRRMALFLRDFTLCSLGEAVRAILPSAALGAVETRYFAAGEGEDPIMEKVREHPGITAGELLREYGESARRRLAALCKSGALHKEDFVRDEMGKKSLRIYSLAIPRDRAAELCREEDKTLRSVGQKRILGTLADAEEWEEKELLDRAPGTRAQLKALLEKELIAVREEETYRVPYSDRPSAGVREPILLTDEQAAAYASLTDLRKTGAPKAALLFGVTGSGKTKVMMRLLDDVLDGGRQAIVLVPEIGLTPQTLSLFCSRYGSEVAVIHSSLSAGERYDAFRRCRAGLVKLVIGTRSAIFAPLSNLGLIVIDEEHEHTYKSDQNPKYHARDVAAFRCKESNALMLLASATPSIESFYKAKTGRYTLLTLKKRYGNAHLPETTVVDMREELRKGNTSPLSDELLRELMGTVERGEQAVLFCNRRGYSSAVSCKSCGEPMVCPNCTVTLTHHASYTGGYLLCHTCGYKMPVPKTCMCCGSPKLSYRGFGTQKAEGEVEALLGTSAVLRMDADTTAGKASYDRMLEKFRAGGAKVLLGTQMVTKGHDFPNVTFSGVLLADASLFMSDYRASERTFALLTQVLGRAGRASKAGRAVIQTFCPYHEVIYLSAKQDYEAFYEKEIALRKTTCFPPFCDIAQLQLSGAEEAAVLRAAADASEWLKERAEQMGGLPIQIFGPLEAQTYKVGGKYRLKFVIKCRLNATVRAYFAAFLREFPARCGKYVTLSADLNPN